MNYYQMMELSNTASEEEIRKAYRKLALVRHPDKGGSKEGFQDLQDAYEVLSNPEKRKMYDATLSAASTQPKPKTSSFPSKPSFFEEPSSYQSNAKPYAYSAFFAREEDVFRPSELSDEDIFTPFVARSPLEMIFHSIQQFINQTDSSPSDREKRKSNSKNDDYVCKQETTERESGIHVSYVFVKAPSNIEMANLIAQTILLTALMVTLAESTSPHNSWRSQRI